MKETFAVDYQGVRFFVANDTESALEILAAAGRPLPPIPEGVNTYLEIFTTAEGKAAAIFQQTGFDERETDMGSEVNGPMIVVSLDGQNAADIESSIETKLHQLHCAHLLTHRETFSSLWRREPLAAYWKSPQISRP